ncbi:MAG: ATP synthase subunit I [Halioglobus sp.]
MTGAKIARPPVHRITLFQCIGLALLALLSVLISEDVRTYSLICGGLVAIVPQAFFALRTFRYRGAQSAHAMARAGYSAEIGKFFLSCVGFAIVFALLRPIDGAAVFAGFVAMLMLHIFGSWWLLK